jgi:hypothetical protein
MRSRRFVPNCFSADRFSADRSLAVALCLLHRHLAHPRPRSRENRIPHRRRQRHNPRLARPRRRQILPVDQHHLNLRRVPEPRHPILRKMRIRNLPIRKLN